MVLVSTEITHYPPHPLKPIPERIVIANSYNVKAASYRDNKEQQFGNLIESAMAHASKRLQTYGCTDTEVAKGTAPIRNSDSLLTAARASHAIFVTSFNAFFEQTHVNVTQTPNGKHREAFYDIVVEMRYAMRSKAGLNLDTLISVRKFHSSRTVLSGLLAAGPNIVSNDNEAQEGVAANVETYLRSFFSAQEPRTRHLYLPKDFKQIARDIDLRNYAEAFDASEKLMESSDKKISANAYYVCAVLAERDGDFRSARDYLTESLKRFRISDAEMMWQDYRLMK